MFPDDTVVGISTQKLRFVSSSGFSLSIFCTFGRFESNVSTPSVGAKAKIAQPSVKYKIASHCKIPENVSTTLCA